MANEATLHEVGREKQRLTQKAIMDYLTLEANHDLIVARFNEAKKAMITMLEMIAAGKAEHEPGVLLATLELEERRVVKWREEFEKENSPALAQQIIDSIPLTIVRKIKIKAKPTIG